MVNYVQTMQHQQQHFNTSNTTEIEELIIQMSNVQQREQQVESDIEQLQKNAQALSQRRLLIVVPKAAPMQAEPLPVANAAAKPAAKPIAKQRPKAAMQAEPVPEVAVH